MCNFLSALVLKTGEIVCDPEYTDSHEDLIESRGLRDDDFENFVRVEFTPDGSAIDEPDKYQFKIDQGEIPAWWSAELQEQVIDQLKARIRAAIRTELPPLLLGGFHIVANGQKARIKRGRIVLVKSTVEARDSSTVVAWDSSKVEVRNSSTVVARGSSKVVARDSSKVVARDSSKVVALDSSTVEALDSSTVEAWGSSTVTA